MGLVRSFHVFNGQARMFQRVIHVKRYLIKSTRIIARVNILLYRQEVQSMDSREVIRILHKDGWRHVRTTGDHFHFRNDHKPGTVTVPHPRKNIPKGTLNSIWKQAGLK